MKSKRCNWSQAGVLVALLLLAPIGASQADADPALIQQGQALYQANCVFCHQADAIGKAGFAPSLTNSELLSMASDKFFMGTIRDGRFGTGMPPFAHLGRKSIKALVAYFRSYEKLPNRSEEVDDQLKPTAIHAWVGSGSNKFARLVTASRGMAILPAAPVLLSVKSGSWTKRQMGSFA